MDNAPSSDKAAQKETIIMADLFEYCPSLVPIILLLTRLFSKCFVNGKDGCPPGVVLTVSQVSIRTP